MQAAIAEAANWSKQWQMPLNYEKVSVLHLGANNPWFQYTINHVQVASASSVKDLGIIVDDRWSFSAHAEKIILKAVILRCQWRNQGGGPRGPGPPRNLAK